MCSVQDEGALSFSKEDLDKKDIKCTKCSEPPVIVFRVDNALCKACFLAYATHKFRAAFGKSRIVSIMERVFLDNKYS